jgi:hypothetical protein
LSQPENQNNSKQRLNSAGSSNFLRARDYSNLRRANKAERPFVAYRYFLLIHAAWILTVVNNLIKG